MFRTSVSGALFVAGIALSLSFPACGKKAPLRLADSRAPEHAPALRARVREGRVTLDFLVPAHRLFPEREDPWVLVRILRRTASSSAVVEAGVILKSGGFEFDSPLSWSDEVFPVKSSFIYHVEFRDAARRRRALSEQLAVSWDEVPEAPSSLTAVGHLRSIILNWTAPTGSIAGLKYRIYRRAPAQELFEQASPDPVTDSTFVDSRIETGRDFCYVVRAVLNAGSLEVEGPASPEGCARAASEELLTP